jgi:hypothetical protein
MLLALTTLYLTAALPAALPPNAPAASKESTLDEVQINGRRAKLADLRKEIAAAEERLVDAFNQFNTVDEFRMTCEDTAPLGTRLKTRECQAKYVAEARAYDARETVEWMRICAVDPACPAFPPDPITPAQVDLKGPEFNRNLAELVKQHPELRRAVARQAALKRQYEAARKEKFKGRWIVFE